MIRGSPRIDLTRTQYQSIVEAVGALLHCIDVEEKFDGIVENFCDLERFILEEALQALVSRSSDDVRYNLPRSVCGRKLSNFLSSARLYLDSIERHIDAILTDGSGKLGIKAARTREFENSFNYRVAEALRNHAQHHALPVHGYTVERAWSADQCHLNYGFTPMLSVAELGSDRKFKKETLAELQAGPGSIELKPLIRSYVESLDTIHSKFRELIKSQAAQHVDLLEKYKQQMASTFPDAPVVALAVFQIDGAGSKLGLETNLSDNLTDYLQFLYRKNLSLRNFARRRIEY